MASDTNLIHGEMAMRQAQGTGSIIGKAVGKTVADAWGVVEAEQDAIDKQVQDYMDQGELTIDAFNVPEHFKSSVAEFSVPNRNDYANIARRAAKQKPGSAAQLESLAEMNKIASEFKTMRTQIDQWVAEQDQYLNGKKNLNYSKANGVLGTEAQMARMFTGKGQMFFQNGNLAFLNEDGTTTLFKDMPHLIKKHTGMTPIYQKAVNTAHKGGVRLSEQDMKNYTQLFTSKFEEAGFGRDAVLSAATDGIVIGNDTIDLKIDPELIKDPARADELRDLVVSQLVNSVAASAESAAAYKEEEAAIKQREMLRTSRRTSGLGPEKKADEINTIKNAVTNMVETGNFKDMKNYKMSGNPIVEAKVHGTTLTIRTKGGNEAKYNLTDPSSYNNLAVIVAKSSGVKTEIVQTFSAGEVDFGTVNVQENASTPYADVITSDLLQKTEEDAKRLLDAKFPAFKFEEKGLGSNTIAITAPNGESKKFGFNNKPDNAASTAKQMQNWMETNAAKASSGSMSGY